MKILTSYFYQIRNFSKNMIPVSTAVWDPKWFHTCRGSNYVFKDKNGVYNGIRYNPLSPNNPNCHGPKDCTETRGSCPFLTSYRSQLDKLDFNKVMSDLQNMVDEINKWEHFREEPILVLIVYETPDNPCSERKTIQDWFKSHGVEVEEWHNEVSS